MALESPSAEREPGTDEVGRWHIVIESVCHPSDLLERAQGSLWTWQAYSVCSRNFHTDHIPDELGEPKFRGKDVFCGFADRPHLRFAASRWMPELLRLCGELDRLLNSHTPADDLTA